MQKQGKQQWQCFQSKAIEQIYQIITGQFYYIPRPFTQQDLTPDLIIKWKVPKEAAIKRSYFNHVSAFVNLPDQDLEQAYSIAEKRILSEMQANK